MINLTLYNNYSLLTTKRQGIVNKTKSVDVAKENPKKNLGALLEGNHIKIKVYGFCKLNIIIPTSPKSSA